MEFPVWEYALDEEEINDQDERTVRPCLERTPINLKGYYVIVRGSFFLADESEMKGLLKPVSLNDSGFISSILPYDLSPILVTNTYQLHFCFGHKKPIPNKIAEKYRILGKTPNQVFPIKFRSDIEIINGITEGILEGFMYFDGGTKDFFTLQSSDIMYIK